MEIQVGFIQWNRFNLLIQPSFFSFNIIVVLMNSIGIVVQIPLLFRKGL